MELDGETLDRITETAIRTAINYIREKEMEEAARVDRRLRNTKLLLKNYKNLKKHAASIKLEIDYLDELLVMDDINTDELAVESIKRSKKRTLVMIRFVEKMLELAESLAAGTKNERKFEILRAVFIEDRQSIKQLADRYGVTTRVIYSELNNAVSEISVLFFGIDSIQFLK